MVAADLKVTSMQFRAIIVCCCKCKIFDEASKLFSELISQGVEVNIITYNQLINGICFSGRLKDAHLLLVKIMKSGMKPDIRTSNPFIDSFSKEGKTEEAEEMIKLMNLIVLKPDIVIYNSVIEAYVMKHVLGKAMHTFKLILSLIEGYFENRQIDNAMSMFHSMQLVEEMEDAEVYGIVTDGLCKAGNINAAREVFSSGEMEDLMNVHIFNVMITGLCRSCLAYEAEDMMKKMERRGYV